MSFFKIFKFAAGSGACTSRRHRDRNTEARCRHRPEEMAGDAAGDALRERRKKVSAAGNPCATLHGKPECSSGLPLLVLK
ncbi:unnamed protein product, partial [Staurois parvus]